MLSNTIISFSFWCGCALVYLLSLFVQTNSLGGNETDRLALLGFKAMIISDPFGVTSSWNDSEHFCQWPAVTCGRRNHRITLLDLRSLELAGSISPYIGNLSVLRELFLQNNSFGGEIPSEIGYLHRLQKFYLSNNSLGGEIPPNITRCTNLVDFHAAYNQLAGAIPPEIGSLSQLKKFNVWGNHLTGNIPYTFGNLSSLEVLLMSENHLSGRIPDSLGKLMSLKWVILSINMLFGEIPPSIFNLTYLENLNLAINQIHGILPSNLGITLPHLRSIAIAYTELSGTIPASLSNASNLEQLQLQGNKLTGKVPTIGNSPRLFRFIIRNNSLGYGGADDLNFLSSLTNATNLEILDIGSNHLGGKLPAVMCNFSTKLFRFNVGDNQIFGSIPTGIENLVNLQTLYVDANHLSGTIPSVIGKLQNLRILVTNYNELSGYIPSSIGNLTLLIYLLLRANFLQGNIPSSLGNCNNLIALDLFNNNLKGSIPPQVLSLSSLSIVLDLSNNHLTGILPIQIGNLKNLGALDVSNNKLSGEIPNVLGECVRLEILYMFANFFKGHVPSSLSSLRGLQLLDISKNNFSGEIPFFFENFKFKQLLNLSYNNFEGAVPKEGVYKNLTATFVMGNGKLCGGIPEFHLPKCSSKHPKRKLTLALKMLMSIFCGLFCLIIVLVLFLFLSRKKIKEPTQSSGITQLLMVSYKSLLKATNDFSSMNLIGLGSFGSVYKGVLEPSGMIIAVKVFNLVHHGAFKSFISECEALRNIKHQNLVKILNVCSGVDYYGNDFKALIYEFMANGSLEEWLHQVQKQEMALETLKSLNLLQRLNVAIDVACALDYLHHQCQIPIVHCDLKPSNVLLDGDMTAHVSDFGLARFLQVQEITNDSSTNQASSIGIRGTTGYVAPEYGMGSGVSTQGDVYSYDILLLKIFTRKRPTDEMFKEGLNLHNYVTMALPDRMATIIDPFLLLEIVEGETSRNNTRNHNYRDTRGRRVKDSLFSILEIGVACSAELPQDRVNIGDVATKLISIRKAFLNQHHLERINNK